jgi:hypothetical protein
VSGDPVVIVASGDLGSASPVVDMLKREKIDVAVIDPSQYSSLKVTVGADDSVTIERLNRSPVIISASTRVWVWHPRFPQDQDLSAVEPRFREYVRKTLQVLWKTALSVPAQWLNRYEPSKQLGMDKQLQARHAAQAGMATIPTVHTNSEIAYLAAVDAFGPGDLALKSAVPWRSSHETGEDVYATYTRRVTRDEALTLASLVPNGPVLVQPYVHKAYELRVTVVADQVFACRINSQGSPRTQVDWRHYDLGNVPHRQITLPPETEAKILELMGSCDLVFGAIDLIVEPDGTHRFVEVNPFGQFAWIEGLTGMPISLAIADWLAGRSIGAPARR